MTQPSGIFILRGRDLSAILALMRFEVQGTGLESSTAAIRPLAETWPSRTPMTARSTANEGKLEHDHPSQIEGDIVEHQQEPRDCCQEGEEKLEIRMRIS